MVRKLNPQGGGGSATNLLHTFTANWIASYGIPTRIYSDAAGVGDSGAWKQWSELHGVGLAQAAARCQWQNGICERAVDLVKTTTKRIREMDSSLSFVKAIEQALFVKNCTPVLGTLVSPMTIMTGRPTILDDTKVNQLIQLESSNSNLATLSLMRMSEIRQEIQKIDARRAVELGLKRNLRAHAKDSFSPGDQVQIFDNKAWAGTYRVLGHVGSSIVVEQGKTIKKFPISTVRKLSSGQMARAEVNVAEVEATKHDETVNPKKIESRRGII